MSSVSSRSNRPRQDYDGVAVTVPVTVPYERYSTRGAHWYVGQALAATPDATA